MGFMENIGKFAKNAAEKTGEFAKNTAEKTSDAVEINKIKAKVHSSEKVISDKKAELGQLLWKAMEEGFVPENEAMIILRDEIAAEYDIIADYNKQIDDLQKAKEAIGKKEE